MATLARGLAPKVSAPSRLASGAALPRSDQAKTGVEFETAAFERALERYVRVTPDDLTKVVKTLAFKLEGKIKKRTPVDTGRARSSWHTVVPGQAKDSFTYTASTEGKAAQRQGRKAAKARGEKYQASTKTYDGSLSVAPADPSTGVIEAIVGSNVEYMTALENGWSKQRPEGMFRVSIAELRGEVEQAIVRVLADGAQGTK